MKNPGSQIFFAALILLFAACGKNEPVNAAVTQPKTPAGTSTAAQPGSQNAEPQVPADASVAQKANETEAPAAATPERITEVDEGPDVPDEPVAKNSNVPLKLAQLPPRAPANSHFKESVNYQRLSPTQAVDVAPDQVQIAEVFWYGCPHCNALDPYLENWRKGALPAGKPAYVVFVRIPAAWNEITRFHARFYFAAESLGRLDELHPLIFKEIHANGNPLNTIDKAREFFGEHGVSANDFQKNFGAMTLERKIDNANLLAQRYRVTGVPHFVVNGKYFTDVGMAGGPEQLLRLLNELAAREHAKE
jgi:protein dithiol oxidoreductase (disulfide-forming)